VIVHQAKPTGSNDTSAFEQLVSPYVSPVFNLVYWISCGDADTCSVTREVFCRLHRMLLSSRDEQPFSLWVYRVAVNVCLDLLPHPPRLKRSAEGEPLRDQLLQALSEHSYEDRAILFFKDVLGLPYEETAEIMDLPIGYVKKSLAFVRMHLARSIDLVALKNQARI